MSAQPIKSSSPSQSKSSSELSTRVLNYQNPELVERFKNELSLSQDDADELFVDLKKFLVVCGTRPEVECVPTKEIDEAWHNFILYTFDYEAFCHEKIGRFVHHLPKSYLNPRSHGDAFSQTMAQARVMFGPLGKNWSGPMGNSCSSERGYPNCLNKH